MNEILFGDIGVDVKGYTHEGLHSLFVENSLDKFINTSVFLGLDSERPCKEGGYLQAECRGPLSYTTVIYVLSGYIRYTTDLDTYLLILSTSLLDIDAANALVNDLYHQGLIKPRTIL